MKLFVGVDARKGILLRKAGGKVKRFALKQLWVQEAIEIYGVEVIKIPRARNLADVLSHEVIVSC